MNIVALVFKNVMRHRLRSALTVLGIAVAVLAFGLLRTVVTAWSLGVQNAAPDRLVTRNRISITFPLPLAQKERIARLPGVAGITHSSWFGGVYKDPKNFFAQIALEGPETFRFFPEYVVDPAALAAFGAERNAAIVGSSLAQRFGWKVGDAIRLKGTIYPGDWDFVIRGIYTGRDPGTDTGQFFFNWNYIEQRLEQESPGRTGLVGWWIVKIDDPARAAAISKAIDAEFDNSADETLTETEAAFAQSFVAMAGAIIRSLEVMSVLLIGVILLVAGNTMAMTVRERTAEYAVLKTLGFGAGRILGLVAGESLVIAGLGGVLGLALLLPAVRGVATALRAWFPAFPVDPATFAQALGAALLVGLLAAVFPVWRAVAIPIATGLRRIE